jgi:short-subunit dehydrogenase
MQLPGRVVIVTGASRGIGLATARLLAAHGAVVVSVGRDATALDRLTAEIGGSVVVTDLAEASSAETIVARTLARHGRIDGVVANAGIGYVGDVAEMPMDQLARLVDVNLRAPLLLARAAVASMLDAARGDPAYGGALVFVSSIAGAVGVPGESVYSATKAGLDAFATVLREELRDDPISVSTVVPGVVATRLLEERRVPYDRRYPRPMPPERVARSVVHALETGADRLVVPRWLVVPSRLAATTPRLYRRLARRFG